MRCPPRTRVELRSGGGDADAKGASGVRAAGEALLRVLIGRLWLCGQEPLRVDFDDALRRELKEYFPAALTYATPRAEASDTLIKRVDALYYAHHRSPAEDTRILVRALFGRFAGLFRGAPEDLTS